MKKKYLIFFTSLISVVGFAQIQIGNDINGESSNRRSGASVSLSADGGKLAVGSTGNWGAVRVYGNQFGNWVQIGSDIEGDSDDQIGHSVSLSSDGDVVAIGVPKNDDNGTDSGQVRVYSNQSGNWVQKGQNIDGENTGDEFGHSVSLSGDGNIVAIGAPLNDGNGTKSGHVRVFQLQSGSWVQLGTDIEGLGPGEESGYSVNLSSNGMVVAIGSFESSAAGVDSGHVRVFEYQSGAWIQKGTLITGQTSGDRCHVVSLSSNGNIIAVGAPFNDNNGVDSGHVRVFNYEFGDWVQLGLDINGSNSEDRFGNSLCLSSDGTKVAIGATGTDVNGGASGQVRLFDYQVGNWVQTGTNINGEASGDYCGFSISLSSNANVVATGEIGNDENGPWCGQVRVFDMSAVLNTENFSAKNPMVLPNPVSNFFKVNLQGTSIIKLELCNLNGKIMKRFKGPKEQYNISEISSGLYILRIHTATKRMEVKILKY